ncbi:hypothetical protein GJU43_00425 [Flavobacterium sp. LC2016-23]|uniref:RNA polymerase sigma factor n=1 Tax=Flavobacterium sp. LC2016-23 TaxID=2666330 RepID=UPI0012B05A63|nr:sigma-70 family RNA polymerase sigma factor [Flavobacterium sp. LC2016-23]MRX37726.1 hypothetical protein [Flavobacterium sp. LC2016-23]
MNLDQLIKDCCRQNRKAQEALYEMYKKTLFVLSLKYCPNDAEAEDNLHDSFIEIFTNIKNAKSFLKRTGKHKINKITNRKKKDSAKSAGKQTFAGSSEVDLIPNLSYYELPIEFVYAFKKEESKIGMEAFTGFSFLISDQNQLSLKSEKVATQNIGEAKNISGINFSYNLRIGISYKLNSKFNLDINPIFKYYLSTFKENGAAKPYSFSIHSGVSYKF